MRQAKEARSLPGFTERTVHPRKLVLLPAALILLMSCTFALFGQPNEKARRERLRALGYVSHPSEPPGAATIGKSGLVLNEPELVAPGFTLITAIAEATALLVNQEGTVVRRWSDEHSESWPRAIMLEGGDVLVMGKMKSSREAESLAARDKRLLAVDPLDGQPWFPKGGQYLARYSLDGTLQWRRRSLVHHDMHVDEEGRILTLGFGEKQIGSRTFQDNSVKILSPSGSPQSERSLFDLLSSSPNLFELPLTTDFPRAVNPQGKIDLLHANAIEQMPFPSLAGRGRLYCDACVLVTVRHQSLVAIIDLEREELLWVWGPDNLVFPHEGRWLENGNLLIFDNGSKERRYSRVVEVQPSFGKAPGQPPAGEIVWSYTAMDPKDFYTRGRGTSQALPNGNVLIASSNQGQVFEVTRNGRVVWRYVMRNDEDKLVAVRAKKYTRSWIRPPTKR